MPSDARQKPDAHAAGRQRAKATAEPSLSETLEDYLEIILELSSRTKAVRVRDVARAKDVRMPTVTWAFKRLAAKGLVHYEAREYAELTPEGAAVAGRVAGRHRFLSRFLTEILGVPAEVAARDACGIEHHLSAGTLERLTAFVEYIETCPEVGDHFLQRFRDCFGKSGAPVETCPQEPCRRTGLQRVKPKRGRHELVAVADLPIGSRGEVARIQASEQIRVELMRRGLMPGVIVEMAHPGGSKGSSAIRVQGQELILEISEAQAIFVDTHGVGESSDETS
jgi:DtxR family Mn-dependent transcriptional regulator